MNNPVSPLRRTVAGLCALGFTGMLSASPMITVDNPDVNVGTIVEGKQKVVEHAFVIKNTGDSVLIIKQVRPG